jgi:hypothetical protein
MYTVVVDLRELQNQTVGRINSLDEFPAGMEDSLNRVINRVVERLDLNDDDRLGLTITATDSNGNEYPIYIPMRRVRNFDGELILNTILSVLPSSLTIALTMSLRFVGIQEDLDLDLGARSSSFPLLHRVSKKSRRVVVIHPDDDPFADSHDCVFQWIGLGLAWLCKSGNALPEALRLKLPIIGIDENLYDKMVRSRRKFDTRYEVGQNIMQILGCQVMDSTTEVLRKAEEMFCCNFILFNVQRGFKVMYPKPEDLPVQDNYVGNEVFGICDSCDFSHVNFCSSPTSFIDGAEPGRCCRNCFELFSRSRVCSYMECRDNLHCNCPHCHTCGGVCAACKTTHCGKFGQDDDDDLMYFGMRRACNRCQAVLFSPRCEDLHESVCADMQAIKCIECGRHSHRGLKCDEVRCLMCSQKMKSDLLPDHVCFIGREKLKKASQNYWTYDFETCLDADNKHVIYLATAYPIFPIQMKPEMGKYCYRILERCPDQPVFVFWGLDGVKKLFEFFKEEFVNGATFFAHNAGKYDSIFIEKFMNEMHGELPEKLQRGNKIMQMVYASNELTFKDSLCFISSSLRAMQKDFGVEELKKGYFPHRLMNIEYLKQAETRDFLVERPPREIWEEDVSCGARGEKEQKELDLFLDEFYATNDLWDIREDSVAYCISDTVLLGEILRNFREQCNALAMQVECADGAELKEFDVLQHVTLPSGVMNLFMSLCLQEKTMAVVDRFSALQRKEAISWCVYECSRRRLPMANMLMFPAFQGVDISASAGNVMFWYTDCYMHGCDRCYSSHNRNFRIDKPFYKLAEEYRTKVAILREFAKESGMELVLIRSHEWERIKKVPSFKNWFADIQNQVDDIIPCDPREAYKGGMTELYKVHFAGDFHIADYVSQYPTSMLGMSFSPITEQVRRWDLPVGRAEISIFPNVERLNTTKLGIVKCRVLPPEQLYAPFLGYKVPSKLVPGGYECIYGLCRICMIGRENRACTHTPEERSIVGVWTICEIQYAMTLGYTILHITEMWEYEGRSETIFKGFIVPFIREKILASRKGLVDGNEFTGKGTQIKNYLELLTGKQITTDMFKDVPVIRQTSKLMMNSIYGKFGQRAVWPSTTAFTESDEDISRCTHLLRDPTLEIDGFELIPRKRGEGEEDEMIAIVNYKKNYPCSRGDAKKHDIIAAHITAYGRQMLNEVAQVLGRNLLYSDTDSLAHAVTEERVYSDGYRIGDLELEVVNANNFWGNGRKSYMYRTSADVLVVKQKGVSLKKSMEPVFSMENMKIMILNTMEIVEKLQEEHGLSYEEALKELHKQEKGVRPALAVDQRQFVTKRDGISGEKITQVSKKYTTFLLEALKRRIVMQETMIDTLPFGWVE